MYLCIYIPSHSHTLTYTLYDNEITSLIDIYFLRLSFIHQTFLDTLHRKLDCSNSQQLSERGQEFAHCSRKNSPLAPTINSSSTALLTSHTDQVKIRESSCHDWKNYSTHCMKTTHHTESNRKGQHLCSHRVPTLRTTSRPSPKTALGPTTN